jgi:hypothetical protein
MYMDISVTENFNLPIGDHYIFLHVKVDVINNYFNCMYVRVCKG